MKKIIIYTLVIFTSLSWISCQEDPEPGGTATQDVAGEWWVRGYIDDGAGNLTLIVDYVKLSTFNTSSNTTDSLWVWDNGNFWDFQVKAAYDPATKTFSVTEGTNVSYPDSEVTIIDGKILLGQGLSSSGVKTDSIYLSSSYNDDTPAYGTQYVLAGHRRTGFLEDEHE
jgi:hypothetical protein